MICDRPSVHSFCDKSELSARALNTACAMNASTKISAKRRKAMRWLRVNCMVLPKLLSQSSEKICSIGAAKIFAILKASGSEGSSSDSSTVFKERNTLFGPMIFYHHDWAFNRSWGLFSLFGGVRAGIGLGTPGVNGLGPVIDAPVVGIEAGVRFRVFGGSIGYLYAPTRASTELGQTYDLGGLYLLASAYLGG